MQPSIKSIFEEECSELKIDRAFYKKICELEAKFVNKKQEHIEFFGGTLTGVQVVRFTGQDRDKLFTDILEVDDRVLEDRLHVLPDINPTFIISSDVFNIACIWIMHAFTHSIYLTDQEKHEGKIRICMYMQYKFLTSKLFKLFRYPADPEVAAATYAQMTMRYALKANGSWGATIRARAEAVIAPDSIHANTIKNLDSDYSVVTMLNDVQGRIKDILKNIMSLHVKINNQGERISTSSSIIEIDGESILRDKNKSLAVYTRYIRSIIPDENSFIRQELVDVICSIMQTMPQKLLEKTLKYCSDNYSSTIHSDIEKSVEMIMEHTFEYLSTNRGLLKSKGDLSGLISKLRGIYMSSRSSETRLLKLRNIVEKIVFEATKSKNDSVLSSTRTGFMLYIVLRSFTMHHYSSK